MKNKLFIFEPSEKWAYCGGTVLVIAENVNKAVELIDEQRAAEDRRIAGTGPIYPSDKFEFGKNATDKHNFWVLTNTIPINRENFANGKTVMENWNYA